MKHSRYLLGLVGAFVAIALVASGALAKVSPSHYCVAIDVDAEGAEALATRFDAFADDVELLIDSSHPLMRVYYPPGRNVRYPTDSSVMIILRRGMGSLGSILSLTPLRNDPPPGLLAALQRFVEDEISNDYDVVLCNEIDGFSAPVTYH